MFKVFGEKSAEKLHVQLSDGRIMSLEDIIRDYERLLKEKSSKQELKVGEWFLIDREVITKNQEKIRRVCNEEGNAGEEYLKRFKESNKIADENPNQYPRIIKTYIFKHDWIFRTEKQMRYMCTEVGDGMCDEVICNLELQMRICNGESAYDLLKVPDKLPRVRVIELRNGTTGYFGGGTDTLDNCPPASLYICKFNPDYENEAFTPYAFRRELS